EPYLPLHRLRALLPGGEGRDPGDPRPDAERGMSFRRLVRWGIAAGVLVAVALSAVVALRLAGGKTGGPMQAVTAPADVVARGKYLAEASDCAACHSAPGGAPFAGGLAMSS